MLTWEAHNGAVTSLAFVPGGGLLSTGTDGNLKHWDALSGSQHYAWKLSTPDVEPESWCFRVLSEATGQYAVAGIHNRGVVCLDLASGVEVGEFKMHRLFSLAAAANGESVFGLGIQIAGIRVWQLQVPTLSAIAKSRNPDLGRSVGLAIAPNMTEVMMGHRRLAWPSGTVAGPVSLATGTLFAVSHDGDKLFGINGTRLMVWGFQTGALRQKLKGHLAPITGLTTTPDGRKLWTASADASVREWDVDTYRCTQCYGLKIGPLGCVAVSPDGLTAAAGSAHNGHIAVWDLD